MVKDLISACLLSFQGWFYPDCSKECKNGNVTWPNEKGLCTCDSCYTGLNCELECSGNGECEDGICVCANEKGNPEIF